MSSIPPATRDELDAVLLHGPQLKVLQFIHFAIVILTVSFAGVTVAVSLGAVAEATAEGIALVRRMSTFHAIFFAGSLVLSKLGFDFRMRTFVAGPDHRASLHRFLARLTIASIVRLGILEAAAFFGLVVCVAAQLEGAMQAQPLFWFNAVSAAVLLVIVVLTFPGQARVREQFWRCQQDASQPR